MYERSRAGHVAVMVTAETPRHCWFCGAICEADEAACWHCNSPIGVASDTPPKPASPAPKARQATPRSYSLASLLLVMTMVSVILGLFAVSPLVGVPVGTLLLVAGVRTIEAVNKRKGYGIAVSGGQVVLLLLRATWTSLAIFFGIVLAFYVGFVGALIAHGVTQTLLWGFGVDLQLIRWLSAAAGWGVAVPTVIAGLRWLRLIARENFAADPYGHGA